MRSPISTAKRLLIPLYLLIPLSGTAFLSGCGSGSDDPAPVASTPQTTTIAPGITRIEVTSVESPTFGGKTFGSVGAYEKIRGKAFGEVDPNDPRNAVIVDLKLAPRNARGNVEYSTDFYILKPIDLSKGNHALFMEVNNRGGKLFGAFNGSSGGNNPTTAADAGDAFLMNKGYTLAWNGWDPSAPSGNDSLTISVPVAKNADGSTITGPAYEYIVNDNATTQTYTLSYAAASLDKSKAKLTVRDHLTDTPVTIADTGWEYTNEKTIRLLPGGTAFKQSAIYEFTYTAKDPIVAGIGFAATRDFVSFLRNTAADSNNLRNPMAGDIKRALAFTVSQPGRYMNDFVWLGFNEDKGGKKVFEGVENWIAGGDGVALNYRFAQPGRTERNRQNHFYPEAPFPFAYNVITDPLTGKTDGRNARCSKNDTCPKIMMVNSANEYWVKAGSLLHTDTQGNDLPDPANVRFYLLSGVEHAVSGAAPNSPGVCSLPRNTTDPNAALRAIFVAMDQWIDGVAPPDSRVPRVGNGTAAFSTATSNSILGVGVVPKDQLGWRDIPGVNYTGLITIRNLFDFGPDFDKGILSTNPPRVTGKVYPSFVSKVNQDDNEIAGIQLPAVAAPVATTTGWGLRATQFGGPDGCESSGQIIPFAATQADRLANGDPRLSVKERYPTHADYVNAVTSVAQKLQADRLLLPADVQRYITDAQNSTIGN